MWIKFTRATVADKKAVKKGDIADISERNARMLVGIGKAEFCDAPANEPEPAKKRSARKTLTEESE